MINSVEDPNSMSYDVGLYISLSGLNKYYGFKNAWART